VAHALLQAVEDVRRTVDPLSLAHLWERPGGAPSVGFHVRHAAGSLDRLFTYARGEGLSAEQRRFLDHEAEPGDPPAPAVALAADFEHQVHRALAQLRTTPEAALLDPRGVGRLQLPSTVLGLLVHAAEHTQRHVGQILTTARIVLAVGRELAAEREARRRLEALAALMPIVASTLEIREIFQRVSAVAREAIPHDALGIQLFQRERSAIVAYVVSDRMPGDSWEYPILRELDDPELDFIVDDSWFEDGADSASMRGRFVSAAVEESPEVVVRLDAARSRLFRELGFRSYLRVPLRRDEQRIGALVFAASGTGCFDPSQLGLAHRVADHVALALAHRHLAEEAERAAEARARAAVLEERVEELVKKADEREGFHRCVGASRPWKEVLKQATRVAATDTTVLLTGESGTGKEVVARFIYRGSPRAKGPLVAVNCAALPEQLLESELFGYERGAFSGALTTKPGRIEQAAGGVLFLDEVGEMSLTVQSKLLRALQEREIQRLGGTRTIKVDVRVIAATNRDLAAAMKRNEFREDLYYRLRVFEIRLPPLRERRDDILPLAEAFLADLERTLGRHAAGLSQEAREILLAHDWPGNIRELHNALERAVILCDGGLITGEHLPLGPARQAMKEEEPRALPEGTNLEVMEKALIERALTQARHNKSKAARLLGLTRAQLYFRLEKYGLADL
jgi:transcriptional regulator with GAF, ATPase, and Fis domain